MNMQSIQMLNLSISDLTLLISECLKVELQKIDVSTKVNLPQINGDLLTRKETSNLLGVSYTTLFHWNNDGTLPAQKIGNRVYYQKSKIMDRLNNI